MLIALTIIVIFSTLFLGLVVFTTNPKSATHRLFFILAIIIVLWAITNYFSLLPSSPEKTLFWIRMVMVVMGATFPTIYLLTKAFPYKSTGLSQLKLYGIVVFIFFTQLLAATPLVFQSIEIKDAITPIPGPGMIIYALNVFGFLFLAFRTLYRKNKEFEGLEKTQLKYLILGIVLTFILAVLTNFIFVNLLKITSFVALGPLFTLILVGFIAYAIVKHRFLDIRLVVARSVAYTLLIVILAAAYAFGLFAIGSFITGDSTTKSSLITSTILALVMAFSFQPLRRFLEKVTDSIFYKDHYDTNKLLGKLSRIMASTFSLEELSFQVLNELMDKLKISRGAFVLTENSTITWVKSVGYKKAPDFDSKQVAKLIGYKNGENANIVVFDEQTEGEIKELMRKNDIEIYIPLETEQGRIGALILAEKSSGDIYSSEDINVLEIIGPQISVAIENAKAYEEIKRFNVTLKEEVRKATADLRKANKRLREMDKLKDEFVSVTSHELRTPMTAVKSYLFLILNKYKDKMDKKSARYLERAYLSTDRMINLVNDMLDVSRIESGRIEIKIKPMDIVKLAEEVKKELQARAKERKLKLEVEKGDVPKVKADAEKIHQVLENIIGNAIKFTPEGGEITVSFEKTDSYVQVNIADTGPGISKEDQKRLFKKFGRLENSFVSMAESGGTGLGLYISKQIINLHKGKIWVESKEGKGSTFSFTLPA